MRALLHEGQRMERGIQSPCIPVGCAFFEYDRRGSVESYSEQLVIMKTKFILLLMGVLTLGSLSSCVAPYGVGYGYNNYSPYYGGFGGYNNYYRPGYAYSGYRSPYYGRPGFSGYRGGVGPGGYRGGGFTHVGGGSFGGNSFGGGAFHGGGFHGGGFGGHHR